MGMKRLYLEVDGVLLIQSGQSRALAAHADEFIEFALGRFECFWCTRYHAGDTSRLLSDLRPHPSASLFEKLRSVRPTSFAQLKTEAMSGDFYWIDSSPIAGEISDLCRRGALDRWIEINTRLRSDDLLRAIDELTRAQFRDGAIPSRIPGIRHRTDFSQWVAFN